MSAKKITRVLVANRGEIAVRVMRTCRELGIETVAVYSEADRTAPHVLAADWAVCIGPPPANESYLRIDAVLDAAARTGADAIHPGYGFLSENPEFVEAATAAGLVFVGPSADAMRLMGSKTRARAAMEAAGVPTVPGRSAGDSGLASPSEAASAAQEIGYPVLIKASAGGGGKGMRLVDSEGDIEKAFAAAQREAKSAFGDESVYLEKAIIRPRHVEIQVFADSHGNTIHLGERDCSIQRRHQKVIEEAPCPVLSPQLREQMGEAAVLAARACDYRGAGTVEFLLDGEQFYFLEMNTRLQVEHPVTEMVYGLDLVAWQLAVAGGEALPLSQEEVNARLRGCAIECRVYAEDSERFLPSPGRISFVTNPDGPFVRNDSGVASGSEVSVFYDPLLSKLVVWGENRPQAIARMRRALDEYLVGGVRTNLVFHHRVLRDEAFIAGSYDTGFIDRKREQLCAPAHPEGESELASVAAAVVEKSKEYAVPAVPGVSKSREPSAWRRALDRP